ncbi:hypothetical protein [Haliscomenobacter sp.]|uniref:hypothetical protein n=1 Tax=Haliscomenobacter sp. TaxID=2717303 RepID=UPI003BAA2DDB
MRVFKPNSLLRAVACSILSVVTALFLSGGFYSFQEPAGFVWNHHPHSSLSFHSNHTQFPPNFSLSLIVETFEEIDDDNQENENLEASVNAFAFTLLPNQIAVKQVIIQSLRQIVLNRKSVLLFILYHSWKSFLA